MQKLHITIPKDWELQPANPCLPGNDLTMIPAAVCTRAVVGFWKVVRPCRAEGISCGVFRDLPEKKNWIHPFPEAIL